MILQFVGVMLHFQSNLALSQTSLLRIAASRNVFASLAGSLRQARLHLAVRGVVHRCYCGCATTQCLFILYSIYMCLSSVQDSLFAEREVGGLGLLPEVQMAAELMLQAAGALAKGFLVS